MTKRTLLSLLISLCAIHSMAQPGANITLGKPYPVVDADVKVYFTQGNEILTVKNEKRKFVLQKLNATTLAAQKVKVYDDFPKGFVLEKITKFKDSYYVFFSLWDGDNEQLFVREIDFAQGQFKGAARKVISVPGKVSGTLVKTGFFVSGVTDKFDFYFSYDSSKMVVQYSLKPLKKADSKNYEIVGAHIFDKNMNEQWTGKLTMPYTEKKMNNIDYSVDSKGNVYIVTSVYKDDTTDEKKRGKDAPNYNLEILKFSAPSGAMTSTKVDLTDKFIHTIWLYEGSSKDYMICAGFYNTGKKSNSADGIVLFKLGMDGKYFDMSTHAIPLSILNQYASRKTQRKNEAKEEDDKAEFEDLKLREIHVQKDGSIILISEQYYIKTHTSYVNGRSSTYYTYHYNDMLVAKVETNGKLAWMQKLPKRQEGTSGQGGMSYRFIKENGVHHFVFLDNEKNKDLEITERPSRHKDGQGGFVTSYTINDKTGSVTKTSIANLRDIKGTEVYQFWPGRIMPAGSGSFIFEAYKKGKEDILIKVDMTR